jgi:hypothetical protein
MRSLSPEVFDLFLRATITAILVVVIFRVARKVRVLRVVIAVLIAGFVLQMVPAVLRPSAEAAARSALEKKGWKPEDLDLRLFQGPGGSWTRAESVLIFAIRGGQAPRYLRVKLKQPVFYRAWQVSEVNEQEHCDLRAEE